MSTTRHPRYYRSTARERVSKRRRLTAPPPRNTPLKRRNSGCGTLFVGGLIILTLLVVMGGFMMGRFYQTTGRIVADDPRHHVSAENPDVTPEPVVLPDTLRDPFTVLLIGVDSRGDTPESVRSDTLIVVHVNPTEEWAGMLSIPRDSAVNIPKLGRQKINAAYTYGYANAETLYGKRTDPRIGGGALAAEAVEGFLGINIDYIAQVDFLGFEQIVDMLGGIPVDVHQPLLDAEYPTENYGFERIYIPAGLQVLDGQTALRYARSRHSGSDFERSQRQQQVLRALLNEIQRRGLLAQVELLPQIVENLEENVTTTLPLNDLTMIRGMVQLAQAIDPDDVMQLRITPDEVEVLREDGSDIYWNQEDVSLLVDRLLAGPSGSVETARIQVLNGVGVPGLAARVTSSLEDEGFLMGEAGDAPLPYEHSLIIDYTGLPSARERLTEVLGIAPTHVLVEPDDSAPPVPERTDIVLILGDDYKDLLVVQ